MASGASEASPYINTIGMMCELMSWLLWPCVNTIGVTSIMAQQCDVIIAILQSYERQSCGIGQALSYMDLQSQELWTLWTEG